MAAAGKKKENFTILEVIYHENKPKGQSKISFKEYFSDPKRTEKILSGAIVVFGLAALVLGFFQIKYNISSSFLPKPTPPGGEIVQQDPNDLLGLRQKDTDGDGLSDYDELNIYHTSPYLKDTDSDGVDDATEIGANTDPNCPAGQNCFVNWVDATATSTTSSANPGDSLFTGQSQVSQLRQYLRSAGMSESDLANFTDQQLLDTYQEVLKQNQGQTDAGQTGQVNTASTTNPTTNTIQLPAGTQLSDLTPAEVRQMLINSGVAKETLDQISDVDLMNLVKDSLSTQ